MKTTYKYILPLIVFALFSCGSSKTQATPEQLNRLTELIQSKNFEINSDMAYPQVTSAMNSLQNSGLIAPGSNVNQINLIGNVNYLRIVGDSIYAELPYYGERQTNAGYNGSDSSIIIDGLLRDYDIKQSPKDHSSTISFNAKAQTELLRFQIIVYPNLKTSMFITGPTRSAIRYSGTVFQLDK